jgi:hypothetical protein
MSDFVPTFANCVKRAERDLRCRTEPKIFYEPKAFTPDTLRNMGHFIVTTGKKARAHIFFYIMWGLRLLRQMAVDIPFTFERPEDCTVAIIEARVAEAPWDHSAVQAALFDCPLDYSYEQVWRLSAAVLRSYLLGAQLAERRLAFAMGTHQRLGEHATALDQDAVRLVLQYVRR